MLYLLMSVFKEIGTLTYYQTNEYPSSAKSHVVTNVHVALIGFVLLDYLVEISSQSQVEDIQKMLQK